MYTTEYVCLAWGMTGVSSFCRTTLNVLSHRWFVFVCCLFLVVFFTVEISLVDTDNHKKAVTLDLVVLVSSGHSMFFYLLQLLLYASHHERKQCSSLQPRILSVSASWLMQHPILNGHGETTNQPPNRTVEKLKQIHRSLISHSHPSVVHPLKMKSLQLQVQSTLQENHRRLASFALLVHTQYSDSQTIYYL